MKRIVFIGLLLFCALVAYNVFSASSTSFAAGGTNLSLAESRSRNLDERSLAGAPVSYSWYALLEAARLEGWEGSLNGPLSGIRNYQEQMRLYKKFLRGGPGAFHPNGPSRHMRENVAKRGQWFHAVDVSRPGELVRVARGLGVDLHAPYPDEPWHIEAKAPFALSAQPNIVTEQGGFGAWMLAALALAGVAVGAFLRSRIYLYKVAPLATVVFCLLAVSLFFGSDLLQMLSIFITIAFLCLIPPRTESRREARDKIRDFSRNYHRQYEKNFWNS